MIRSDHLKKLLPPPTDTIKWRVGGYHMDDDVELVAGLGRCPLGRTCLAGSRFHG